jgi:hypothetical protein
MEERKLAHKEDSMAEKRWGIFWVTDSKGDTRISIDLITREYIGAPPEFVENPYPGREFTTGGSDSWRYKLVTLLTEQTSEVLTSLIELDGVLNREGGSVVITEMLDEIVESLVEGLEREGSEIKRPE